MKTDNAGGEVVDRPDKSRFELPVGGTIAFAEYRRKGDRITLVHTEVPEELSGQGIGTRLAKGVFEALRASGRRAALKCEFMQGYAKRHPEYADLVEGTAAAKP
jgi:predicted GNAT family acetyltransferase